MQELSEEHYRGGNTTYYGRDTDALVTYEFKTFKEKFGADVKKRIAGYRDLRYSNNADAESVSLAAQRLAAQRSDRKILIVISDGQPATRGNMTVHKKALKENIKNIEKAVSRWLESASCPTP
jgi:nitric oxide reductase activation protein